MSFGFELWLCLNHDQAWQCTEIHACDVGLCCTTGRHGTIDTSLLVASVNEQVSGALRKPRQGEKLNEARDGVTGEKILPAWLTTQNLSWNKQSSVIFFVCKSNSWFGVQSLPEPNHLTQHNTKRCEDGGGQGGGPSEALWGTLSKVHGLYIHADPFNTTRRTENQQEFLCYDSEGPGERRHNSPAFMPVRTRERMIISKDLAALLVSAKRAADMRKRLFSSKHFFLDKRNSKKNDCMAKKSPMVSLLYYCETFIHCSMTFIHLCSHERNIFQQPKYYFFSILCRHVHTSTWKEKVNEQSPFICASLQWQVYHSQSLLHLHYLP